MTDAPPGKLLTLEQATELGLRFFRQALESSTSDATHLFVVAARAAECEPLEAHDSLVSHAYHPHQGHQFRHLVQVVALEPAGEVQHVFLKAVRATLFPEYLDRWVGLAIRNVPSRHGSSSLVHRLSHALKQCFDARAAKAIAGFQAQLITRDASNALATHDVDELFMDVLNLALAAEAFAAHPTSNSEKFNMPQPESLLFKETLDLRVMNFNNRPNTAQEWMRDYFASSPPPVARSSKRKQTRRHTLNRGPPESPLPRIAKRSSPTAAPKEAAPKSDAVDVLMKALDMPKYLAVDFVREGFDMTRVGALQQALQEYNEAKLESATEADQCDQQSTAALSTDLRSSVETPRSHSTVGLSHSTGQQPSYSSNAFTAGSTNQAVFAEKSVDHSERRSSKPTHTQRAISPARSYSPQHKHGKTAKASRTLDSKSTTSLHNKRLTKRVPAPTHVAINCAIYGQRRVVVKAEPDFAVQEVIDAALSKLSRSLRIYRRDLLASQSSITWPPPTATAAAVEPPHIAYDAFREGEHLDFQQTIVELGIHANDTIQLMPQMVKELVYSS